MNACLSCLQGQAVSSSATIKIHHQTLNRLVSPISC